MSKKSPPPLRLVQTRIPANAAEKMAEKISGSGHLTEAGYLRHLILRDLGMLD